MANFFFTQEQNMEMIVKAGKPIGGAVVATQVWMKALHELGHEVFLARFENDDRPILDEYSWINTIRIFNPHKGIPVIRWLTYRFPKYYYALKKREIDYLIDSIPSWGSFFLGIICRKLEITQIIRIANDNMLDERIKLTHSFFDRFFIFMAFNYSKIILVQNDFQFQALKLKFPKKEILKIFNPFIIDRKNLMAKSEVKGYIAWVANFRYQKNLKLLFNIANVLKNEEFKIAGIPLLPLDDESKGYIEKLKVLPNVHFVGQVPRKDILDFFSGAKFLLNTSRYEGFSNTFLEAMTCGVPILTTNSVNPDGIISTFKLGLVYENESDLKLILDSITKEDYFRMSQKAINYIQENHDYLVLGKRFLNSLGKIPNLNGVKIAESLIQQKE